MHDFALGKQDDAIEDKANHADEPDTDKHYRYLEQQRGVTDHETQAGLCAYQFRSNNHCPAQGYGDP
jgi:hypothetical protein